MKAAVQRGFTLLETLVALAILSLSLVAILRVVGAGLRGAAVEAAYAETLTLAENELARLVHDAPVAGTQELPTGHRVVREVRSAPGTGLVRVTVTVEPPEDAAGVVVTLVTLAEPGRSR